MKVTSQRTSLPLPYRHEGVGNTPSPASSPPRPGQGGEDLRQPGSHERRSFFCRLPALTLAIALWALSCGFGSAWAGTKNLAVLVIGRTSDRAMMAREAAIIRELTQLRVQRGWNQKLLPIYSYHFDKAVERDYCEQRLKVHPADLLVVGLVELDQGVPVDFVYRVRDVAGPDPVSEEIMDRAQSELAARGLISGSSSPEAASPTPPPARPPAVPVTQPAQHVVPVHAATAPTTRPAAHTDTVPVVVSSQPAPVVVVPQRPTIQPAGPRTTTYVPVYRHPVATTTAPSAPYQPPAPVRPHVWPYAMRLIPSLQPTLPDQDKWSIQVGLFTNLQTARALVGRMRRQHFGAEIFKGWKSGVVAYRVVVGTFHGQHAAYEQARALQASGQSAFSVRIDRSMGTVVR